MATDPLRERLSEYETRARDEWPTSHDLLDLVDTLNAVLNALETLDANSPDGPPGPHRDGYMDGINESMSAARRAIATALRAPDA